MKNKTKKQDNHCKICSTQTTKLFSQKILKKYTIEYFQCPSCAFIQTEKPHWLDEAYHSPINIEDTGILQRNILLLIQLTPFLLTLGKDAKILDFGGGYGFFTRLLRDIGFDAYWEDPFCTNLTSRGFEAAKNQKIAVITAFEVFEHIEDPDALVRSLLKKSDILLFTTQTTDEITKLAEWWYMGYSHGQHISIYSKKSLQQLAAKHNTHAISIGSNLHVISKKPISFIQRTLLGRLFSPLFPLVFFLRRSKTYSDHLLLRQ